MGEEVEEDEEEDKEVEEELSEELSGSDDERDDKSEDGYSTSTSSSIPSLESVPLPIGGSCLRSLKRTLDLSLSNAAPVASLPDDRVCWFSYLCNEAAMRSYDDTDRMAHPTPADSPPASPLPDDLAAGPAHMSNSEAAKELESRSEDHGLDLLVEAMVYMRFSGEL